MESCLTLRHMSRSAKCDTLHTELLRQVLPLFFKGVRSVLVVVGGGGMGDGGGGQRCSFLTSVSHINTSVWS